MPCPYCLTDNHEGATRCAACGSWMVERDWTRARDGRRLAGVCRGLANRFGVPVAALRLLFLGSILFGGWGILAYLALWIALPWDRPEAPAAPARFEPVVDLAPLPAEPVIERR